MSTGGSFSKKALRSNFGVVYGYVLVSGSTCWHSSVRSEYADDTVGLKDRIMHYELISSVLLSLIPYSFDDCDTAVEYVQNSTFLEYSHVD